MNTPTTNTNANESSAQQKALEYMSRIRGEKLHCRRCNKDKPVEEFKGKSRGVAPKNGDLCMECRKIAQQEGRARAAEHREYKTPADRRAAQAERMRQRREDDPHYSQPRVNRATLAYCPECKKIMPWSSAVGTVKEGDLTCPACGTTLKTVTRARSIGVETRRSGEAICIKCGKVMYWHQATTGIKQTKNSRGKVVSEEKIYTCPDDAEPLYAIMEQRTGARGN